MCSFIKLLLSLLLVAVQDHPLLLGLLLRLGGLSVLCLRAPHFMHTSMPWVLHRSVENTLSIMLFSVIWLQGFVYMCFQNVAQILNKIIISVALFIFLF